MKVTLKKWKKAHQRLHAARAELDASLLALDATDKEYRRQHPLDESAKQAIVEAFRKGRPLCCEKGRATLLELGLDECWRAHINGWVYDSLGCNEFYRPGGSHYKEGLRDLCNHLEQTP